MTAIIAADHHLARRIEAADPSAIEGLTGIEGPRDACRPGAAGTRATGSPLNIASGSTSSTTGANTG
ncbi:hypothetical protein BKK79_19460 [Cupriavidus sp. USMAA2-4]|nr:hypothetical protein BKK79_19460 [Cupriavidus sp. USMAA2-4]